MKTFNITITTKNNKSLQNFFAFLDQTEKKSLKKYFQKRPNTKRFAILKSPHVNKTAQEIFEIKKFKKQVNVQVPKAYNYIIFLKRLNTNMFPDVSIKLKYHIEIKRFKKFGRQLFRLDNFGQNSLFFLIHWRNKNKKFSEAFKKTNIKTSLLLKSLDLYGEFLKNMSK